uniref:Uncharacterized protein n=1 Tax=viral metagenome TaxID=1070528 RepID=A0A6M3KR62_9ZZZZ
MILKWHGIVEDPFHGITVDGHYIVAEVWDAHFPGKVTVIIADKSFSGDLEAFEEMRGYGEYTPGEPEELTVGPHDIIEILRRYEGQVVTLWIADEPVNTLEDSEVR